MHPFEYCAAETERQSGTMAEAVGMFSAWQFFASTRKNGYRLIEDDLIKANRTIFNNPKLGYRKVPAVFNQGVPALDAALVPHAMNRLGQALNSAEGSSFLETPRMNADFFTREFLLVHPFADGNGRVGSLMWNVLNETIADPEPMPYFFGSE
jgi:hypothetical protein